jgi:endonuclease YncB( thermonuclease family)
VRVAGAAALLAACAFAGPSPPPTIDPALPTEGEVTAVVDGDTIEVETRDWKATVRLAGINAPDRDECLNEEASDHLAATIAGTVVSLEILGTDQFDRTLAHVFARDSHINREMVATGLALVSDPAADDPHRASLLDAEAEAVDSARRMWGADACGADGDLADVVIDPTASVPDPPGPDDTALHDEVIAIVNRSTESIDLSGWALRDTSSRHRYTFPEGTAIDPEEALAVRSDARDWDPGGTPVWNNDGDMALLLDPLGTVVSHWRY